MHTYVALAKIYHKLLFIQINQQHNKPLMHISTKRLQLIYDMKYKICFLSLLFQLQNESFVESFYTSRFDTPQQKGNIKSFLVDYTSQSAPPKRIPAIAYSAAGQIRAVETITSDENLHALTTSLLDKQDDRYWSKQLTSEQMERIDGVIQGWSTIKTSPSKTVEAAQKVELIIRRLEDEKKSGNDNIDLNSKMYNTVIDLWSKSGKPERAEAMLKKMEYMAELFPDSIILSNVSYNTVIHCWKRCSNGEKAEQILQSIKKVQLEPDDISYNGVVLAYTRNFRKSGYAAQAQRVLSNMEESLVQPNIFLYNAVLDAYAKSQTPQSAQKAELLLRKMEKGETQPNTISYTTLIDAYAKSKSDDNALNAERVFKIMEAAYSSGNLNAKPNNRSFNALINAYVQNSSPSNALRAEEILMKMLELSNDDKSEAKPNVVTFTTVINGWAKSAESGGGERAQKLCDLALEQYEEGNVDALPNSFLYSALIDAWTKSRDKGGLDQAVEIYSDLHGNFTQGIGSIKPSTFLANQVIDAVSRSGARNAGAKAEEVLCMLEDVYNKYNDNEMKPNAASYTSCMNAWAKSNSFGKARKAQQLLIKMEDAYKNGNRDAKPTVFPFTAVLNACAFTVGDLIETKEALKIASKTYRDLCSSNYDKPNSITFATFLRVVLNLIPKGPKQEAGIVSIFRKCCEQGQVNELILGILKKSVSKQLLKDVTGVEENLTIADIPSEWKCNVKTTKRDQRRQAYSNK